MTQAHASRRMKGVMTENSMVWPMTQMVLRPPETHPYYARPVPWQKKNYRASGRHLRAWAAWSNRGACSLSDNQYLRNYRCRYCSGVLRCPVRAMPRRSGSAPCIQYAAVRPHRTPRRPKAEQNHSHRHSSCHTARHSLLPKESYTHHTGCLREDCMSASCNHNHT